MREVFNFLCDLYNNNNREWFAENKDRYNEVKDIFNKFAQDLINNISTWDSDINPDKLRVEDCTYRIYRDIRFSKNKQPYKTHMGVYICKGGKKSPYAGYYFHLEPKIPDSVTFIGESMLYSGLHCPEPKQLFSVRDEISVNGNSFINAINLAKNFTFDNSNSLKRLPKGFENVDKEWEELVKCKDYSLYKRLEDDFLFAPNLAERVSDQFKTTKEFILLLNKAIDFSIEEL